MAYIFIGSIAFALLAIYDWAQMRKNTWPNPPVIFLFSAVALTVGAVGVLSAPAELEFASWVQVLAWIGLIGFLPLLIYSTSIEIPLRLKYQPSSPDDNRPLVDTGTYALSRHPGVLWFGGAAACTILIHPSGLTLVAGIFWTVLDVLLVWVEDRYVFPNTFPGYIKYKTRTPFLIPNRTSIRRFKVTLSSDNQSENTSLDIHQAS
jgi:protein-S-isoprenylcysteine O-methyltransferase Ste14